MEIRSYRRVFDLERRVYSIDRLRLNPTGVPVRGILYGVALLTASLVLARLPLLGALMGRLPWFASDLALPLAGASVLSIIRVEGRTFHLAAYALLRYAATPRRLSGLSTSVRIGERWYPQAILFLPDGSDSHMRRLRYRGPGAALVAIEHDLDGRARERGASGVARGPLTRGLTVCERPDAEALGEGRVISVAAGARLLIRSGATAAARR